MRSLFIVTGVCRVSASKPPPRSSAPDIAGVRRCSHIKGLLCWGPCSHSTAQTDIHRMFVFVVNTVKYYGLLLFLVDNFIVWAKY